MGVTVSGWAVDQDAPSAVQRLYVTIEGDAPGRPFGTSIARPDVARAYSDAGQYTGFRAEIPWSGRGRVEVCLWAIDPGAADVRLGCRWVLRTEPGLLLGRIDSLTVDPADPDRRVISGWVLNRGDAISPTPFALAKVEKRVSGDPIRTEIWTPAGSLRPGPFELDCDPTLTGQLPRPDVDRAYPDNGSHHGFRISFDPDRTNWTVGDRICIAFRRSSPTGPPSLPVGVTQACAIYPG